MESEEVEEEIPNIKICLDDLKIFNESNENRPKRVNVMRVKLDTLKLKSNYDKLKELQQSPKISRVSQLLTSPSSTKSSYVSSIKEQSRSGKLIPKKTKKIDYSKCNSLSQFAISKSSLKLSEVDQAEAEKGGKNECELMKDMYDKGLAFISKKKKNLEKKIQIKDEEDKKVCTFAPELKSNSNGKKKLKKGKITVAAYKPLSPYVSGVAYQSGCDIDSIKSKCTEMHNYLTVKMPNES